ncbi:MAG: hypothetical protein HY691_10430 [Chloroflexi bacterium]|nr:hypothetical protein [Chloroflexota bacterium]
MKVGLRSNDAFLLRSCQILLASARGAWMPRIAATLGEEHLTIPEMIA